MAEKNGIYKCGVCGNTVSMIDAGAGQLVCCNQPMNLLEEKTEEEGYEKHLPVVEISEGKVKVTVGATLHPMEEKHYIELIQLVRGDKIIAEKRLFPGQEPIVEFCIDNTEGIIARELCNIHGLWKK
jgi:superoxide reductase